MKNAITHLIAQRAKRDEQHMKIETRHIDEILVGVEKQINEINTLSGDKRELEKKNSALADENAQLKRKLEKRAAPSAA